METGITNINSQELISQSKSLSGSNTRNFIPYIPIISINNDTKEKEVEVDGKMQKVEIPAVEGFNITLKGEDGTYNREYYINELSAVILRVRYSISSKNKVTPRYYSYEYDQGDYIKIYDENKNVLAEGNYQEIKKAFETSELNSLGKPVSSFDLNVILYLDINGEIFRYKVGNASRSNFFEYSSKFGNNDTFTAYKTNFNLKFNDDGKIKFWYTEFEKGEQVDLSKEIPLQQEIQKFFAFKEEAKKDVKSEFKEEKVDPYFEGATIDVDDDIKEEKKDDIDVSQIPF